MIWWGLAIFVITLSIAAWVEISGVLRVQEIERTLGHFEITLDCAGASKYPPIADCPTEGPTTGKRGIGESENPDRFKKLTNDDHICLLKLGDERF